MSSNPRIPSKVSCTSSTVRQNRQYIGSPDASDLRIVSSWSSRSRGSLNVLNRATNSSHFLYLARQSDSIPLKPNFPILDFSRSILWQDISVLDCRNLLQVQRMIIRKSPPLCDTA